MEIPKEELEYLAFAKQKIAEELAERNAGQEEIQKDLYEKRKYLWEELVGNDRAAQDRYEEASQKSEIKAGEKMLGEANLQIIRLKRLQKTPYFARIDFKEEGFPEESFYIGKFGLTDRKHYEQIICDWRSDIASIYYNYEPGPAEYTCEMGTIDGNLTRKRQFQIERGELIGCFDSTISIEDYFLQKILSAHAGSGMKTIVDSIQQQQNEIIRENDSAIVLINGCAGSGKTSIALHRIAYQLYRSRKTLKASDCMIFSPNNLFEDYIASVLPDLGEDNVWQTTFADFASSIFGANFDVRSYIETLAEGSERLMEAKGSREFAAKLRAVCETFEAQNAFDDFSMEGILILSGKRQDELFAGFRKSMNYTQSCNRLKKYALEQAFQVRKELRQKISDRLVAEKGVGYFLSEKEQMAEARLQAIQMSNAWGQRYDAKHVPDAAKLYAELLEAEFGAEERKRFEKDYRDRVILFEDSTALLYLMRQFGQLATQEKMRQIVVDEAQDYTELQYILMLELYPYAHFTILGDRAQTLAGNGCFWESVAAATKRSCRKFELDVNYRSSKEIVEFTNRMAGEELCRAIDRSGGPVRHETVTEQELAEQLNRFLEEGNGEELAAVVCAVEAVTRKVYKLLNREDSCLLEHEFASRNQRICVLPVYLAKGLEFDRVAVVNDHGEMKGGKLYVACTRALHQLALFDIEQNG